MDNDETLELAPPDMSSELADRERELQFARRDWSETPTDRLTEPGGVIPDLPVWEEPDAAFLRSQQSQPKAPLRLVARQTEPSHASVTNSLTMRTTVALAECANLREQLTHAWRSSNLVPTVEDVVLLATARAFREVWSAEARIGLRRIDGNSEQLALVPSAAGHSFREAVELLAASPRQDVAVDIVVTSFLGTSVEQADPRLDAALFALTVGAERSALLADRSAQPCCATTTLSLGYAAESVPDGVAAALLSRVRELVEAPYALLAD